MRRGARLPHLALRVGIAILAATGLALVATGAAARPAAGPARGGVLRLGYPEDYGTLDPAVSYNEPAWRIEYATCAKLFNYPDRPGTAGTEPVPEVVRRYTVSKDLRTYTFELRRTFRFHTGTPVTAASFAAAFNRDADPKLKSPAVAWMHEIAGAGAVTAGKARTISGVRVLGRYRLRIRLLRPLGDLPARLTMPFFCPVPPGTAHHELELPPGSGPYYAAEHVVNKRIVLRRNPYYRGERPAYVDRVDWRLDVAQPDCIAATERGEVDQCTIPVYAGPRHDASRDLARRYGVNRPGGRYFVAPGLTMFFYAFNHDRPAFRGPGQVPLAKAINYALDRRALLPDLGAYGGTLSDRILPASFGRGQHLYPLRGDPSTARRLVATAKVKPRKLVFYTWNKLGAVHEAEVLREALSQLGIALEVKYYSVGVLYQKLSTRGEPYDIAFISWAADYPDPVTYFRPLAEPPRKTGNVDYSYLDDPQVRAAIDDADRLNGAARRKAFADLDTRLMQDDPPWAPVGSMNYRTFVSAGVGCFFTHPVYWLDVAAICKKKAAP